MRKALIRKLHEMQKWRRGGGVMPLTPKDDHCIRMLRNMNDEQVNEIMRKYD